MSATGAGWTEARVARLKELVSQRLSAGDIAADLGIEFSRNAVLGKIHRLGLAYEWNRWQFAAKGRQRKRQSRTGEHRRGEHKPASAPAGQQAGSSATASRPDAGAASQQCHDPPHNSRKAMRKSSVAKLALRDAPAGGVRFADRRMHRQCAALLNFGAPPEALMCCGGPIELGSSFEFCDRHLRIYLTAAARRAA